jgi:hypothetical protein
MQFSFVIDKEHESIVSIDEEGMSVREYREQGGKVFEYPVIVSENLSSHESHNTLGKAVLDLVNYKYTQLQDNQDSLGAWEGYSEDLEIEWYYIWAVDFNRSPFSYTISKYRVQDKKSDTGFLEHRFFIAIDSSVNLTDHEFSDPDKLYIYDTPYPDLNSAYEAIVKQIEKSRSDLGRMAKFVNKWKAKVEEMNE